MSQIDLPFPSSLAAPSIWYDAVATPQRKPFGNSRACGFVTNSDSRREVSPDMDFLHSFHSLVFPLGTRRRASLRKTRVRLDDLSPSAAPCVGRCDIDVLRARWERRSPQGVSAAHGAPSR